jgi:hypothetical protein
MTPNIPSLIHKLRNAPQLVGTFGRGDPDPIDQYMPGMTGEERDWLIKLVEQAAQTQFGNVQPWFKILADNWRGRKGNSTTGDSVRNSCADELEKVAARYCQTKITERLYTLKEATTALEQAIQTLSLTRQKPQS